MPKKKTRKQKEKTEMRRAKQLAMISSRNQGELTDKPISETKDATVSPTLSPQTPLKSNIRSTNSDLKTVIIMVIIFVLLLTALVITENQYNYLSPLSKTLMDFLLQR